MKNDRGRDCQGCRWFLVGLPGLAAVVLVTAAAAAGGALDTSFGNGGKVTTDFGGTDDYAYAVAIEQPGKIVVGGSSGPGGRLARYIKDGSLDTTFGSGGSVTTALGVTALAIQDNGKIVAAGGGLARYNDDGSLDTSFGSGGTVSLSGVSFSAVEIQDNGKIVAAAHNAITRFNRDGSLDTSFGSGGSVSGTPGEALAIDPSGKIVVAGTAVVSHDWGFGTGFALARYNTDGSLDTSFGSGGSDVTDFPPYTDFPYRGSAFATAVAIQNDRKIVVVGGILVPITYRAFAIARYNPDGSLDTSFGAGGAFITDVPDRSTAEAVAIQNDGKIVAIGNAESVPGGFEHDLALVRYDRDGSLDAGFDSDGRVYTDFGMSGSRADDFGNAVAIKMDGTILAAGSTRPRVSGSDSDFAVAAYEGR
jgi:uncharacterized delta-60 repeat protein